MTNDKGSDIKIELKRKHNWLLWPFVYKYTKVITQPDGHTITFVGLRRFRRWIRWMVK